MEIKPKKIRGFAAMSPEMKRELASRGGRAARDKGTAYRWNSETAKIAGAKGGAISRKRSKDPNANS